MIFAPLYAMNSTSPAGPPPLDPAPLRPRWQFGLRWLFVLTTTAAAIAALARYTAALPVLRIVLVVYLIGVSIYVFLKLPGLLHYVQRLRQLRERRRELAEWVASRREAPPKPDDVSDAL